MSLLSAIAGVWIIIGAAASHCDEHGCPPHPTYWTGSGWSDSWREAKQYPIETDIAYVIPNGMHCCYSEEPTRIDPETGEILGYGPP